MGAISLAWAAFWIALAAVIVSGRWFKARRELIRLAASRVSVSLLSGFYANPRMQREPRVLLDAFPWLPRSRRHGLQ